MDYRIRILLFFVVILSPVYLTGQTKDNEASLINIETNDLSLIFKKEKSASLKLVYFGEKLKDAAPLLEKRFLHRPDTKEDFAPEGYLSYGGRVYLEPVLKATHSDGAMTTISPIQICL